MLFKPGRIVATPAALERMQENRVNPGTLLTRHLRGDWGELGKEDAALNDEAVTSLDRIMSVYPVGTGKVWIITDAGHEVTTFLLPDDY